MGSVTDSNHFTSGRSVLPTVLWGVSESILTNIPSTAHTGSSESGRSDYYAKGSQFSCVKLVLSHRTMRSENMSSMKYNTQNA